MDMRKHPYKILQDVLELPQQVCTAISQVKKQCLLLW